MRIISGRFKGRRIEASNKVVARPTTDFAKEGLFNLLNNRIDFEGIRVLDLFSGTGSISIEFISRDCCEAIAIEQSEKNGSYIRKACQELKIDNLTLIKTDVFRFLPACKMKFDVIFADPPYDLKNLTEIPDLIFRYGLLEEGGLFILEHSAKNKFDTHPFFSFHRNYGNVNFTFFESPDKVAINS